MLTGEKTGGFAEMQGRGQGLHTVHAMLLFLFLWILATLCSNFFSFLPFFFFFFFFFFFCFLWPHLWHMEVPRLQVESKLQLPAYATATPDPSHICNLCHSSQQHQILNPVSEARDRTLILMDTSRVLNPLSHKGNSLSNVISKGVGIPVSYKAKPLSGL